MSRLYMAQPYQQKVAESREALDAHNNTPGNKGIVYYIPKDGFKCSVNGCEFRELVGVFQDRKSGNEREQRIIEGELVRPDGTRCWVYQGIAGWRVDAHNAHAMQAMVKAYNDGEKSRKEAALGSLMEQVKTMKLANLPSVAIVAALKAQGVDSITAEAVAKAS